MVSGFNRQNERKSASDILICLSIWRYSYLLLAVTVIVSCSRSDLEEEIIDFGPEFEIPQISYPSDNPPGDSVRIALGRSLFYDVALSIDSSVSCGSCHIQSYGFADNRRVSIGAFGREGRRNSPSLVNVAYSPYLMREGGVPTLEMQALVPIQEHDEFSFHILKLSERLGKNQDYERMSQMSFGRSIDPYVITRSIGAFVRTIVGFDSRFDRYLKSRDRNLLTADELAGMRLFYSDSLACGKCHSGIHFTDFTFRNNGLYEAYQDPGRFLITREEADRGKFKVPTLRFIGQTSPYMHDGSIATLKDVILHYSSGGKAHEHKDPLIRGFTLSEKEIAQLQAFLLSLTSPHILSDPTLGMPQ